MGSIHVFVNWETRTLKVGTESLLTSAGPGRESWLKDSNDYVSGRVSCRFYSRHLEAQ